MQAGSTPDQPFEQGTEIWIRNGGLPQAEADFGELTRGHPIASEFNQGNPLHVCNVPDGPTIILRGLSSLASPRLDIIQPSGARVKFRYP